MKNIIKSLLIAGYEDSKIVEILARYDYSCLMCALPDNLKEALKKYFFGKIKDNILYLPEEEADKYGREDEFHITVKYGLKETNPELFRKYLKPVKIRLGPVSKFEQDDYDVLKVGVISEGLNSINKNRGKYKFRWDLFEAYVDNIKNRGKEENDEKFIDLESERAALHSAISYNFLKDNGIDINEETMKVVRATVDTMAEEDSSVRSD